jgi:hypothetical protein
VNLEELIAEARVRSNDQAKPYLTADPNYITWAAQAEAEAAVRASLLFDDTSAFCTLELTDGQDVYPLDPRIWRIDSVWLLAAGSTRQKPLELVGIDRLRLPGECGTFLSRPQRAAHQGGKLRLWPTPTSSTLGTLTLRVYRLPLRPLSDLEQVPEIDTIHHDGLVDWMLYRAYSQKDGETYDPGRAGQALVDFTNRFGDRPSADALRQHNERRQHTTNYGGF